MSFSVNISSDALKQMVNYARKYSKYHDLDPYDFVQNACLRSISALKRKGISERPSLSPQYIWKALNSEIVDMIRKNEREKDSVRIYEPKLIDHDDIYKHIKALDRKEKEIIILGKSREEGWARIEDTTSIKNVNLRKRYSRATEKLLIELIIDWYQKGRFEEINRYRLSINLMKKVGLKFLQKGLPISILTDSFKNEHRNRTIQNATWALAYIGIKKPEALNFLESQMTGSNLFRGNKTYIAEALLGLNAKKFADLLRKSYLPRLLDMNSRVSGTSISFREEDPIRETCLVDIIDFQPVGPEIPSFELEIVRKQFLKGSHDVDLHRALAWILLRTMSNNGKGLTTVVDSLVDEFDQTNAYYVTKFVMVNGIRMFPDLLLNKRTLESLKRVKYRWPQNPYFAQSAARFSMKLKDERTDS